MNWQNLLNDTRLRTSGRPKTNNDNRNEYESDFGRVVFSPATRRMHDKTQVFPLTSDDNIHSRLTHSMEVMTIGYSLGLRLCDNQEFIRLSNLKSEVAFRQIPVILKSACLIHDIGNPPFGHFGESVIKKFFISYFRKNSKLKLTKAEKEDFTLFDGNAQGFRVLTKLQRLNDLFGLNLTYATLAAYVKYPNTDSIDDRTKRKSKRGVFQSEKDYLTKVFDACDLIKGGDFIRHPLAYLMEASDSICYLTMDIEDGANKKLFSYDSYIQFLCQHVDSSKIKGFSKHLKAWKSENEITKLVQLRIFLINYLVGLALNNFISRYKEIANGKYNEELIFDDDLKVAETLQAFCRKFIFPNREITSLELAGDSVITGLLNAYTAFLFGDDKGYRKRVKSQFSDSLISVVLDESKVDEIEKLSDYSKLRLIVDYVSGMTDQFALSQYQKLSGQKIS